MEIEKGIKNDNSLVCKKTKYSFLLMILTDEPLASLVSLLPFTLRKEFSISVLQLSLFLMLRPVLSSFSFFWGMHLNYNKNKSLLNNHMVAWFIARLPFLLFPFFNNFYYVFFATAIYQLFKRAGMPAWFEIVKRKIKNENTRQNVFSIVYIASFLEGIILGFFIGRVLDYNWKIVYLFASLFGLSSLFIQRNIKIPKEEKSFKSKENFLTPFKDVIRLLQERKDFLRFQIGFMIGGGAIMLVSPAMNILAADILKLSYGDIVIAKFVIAGFSFALSSYYWKLYLNKTSINYLTIWVLLGFSLYLFSLFLSKYITGFYFLAYFFYGIAQGGSMFFWNISGVIFSKEENSTLFTSTNLLCLGVRGLIMPLLGSLFCSFLSPSIVILIGSIFAFWGFYIMGKFQKKSFSYSS